MFIWQYSGMNILSLTNKKYWISALMDQCEEAALGEDHKMAEKNSLQLEFQEMNISLYD